MSKVCAPFVSADRPMNSSYRIGGSARIRSCGNGCWMGQALCYNFEPMDKLLARLLLLATLTIMVQSIANGQKTPGATAPVAPPKLKVVPDIAQRVAKYKPVQVPFQSALNPRERQLVQKLVEASRYIEDIYWRQSDPEGLELYQELVTRNDPGEQNLRQFLFINASRYDLLEENQPFVCTESAATANGGECPPMYPGRGFFPTGLTREQIEQYVKAHPEMR